VIRILLVEDMNMVRGALVALLGLEPDFEIVGDVTCGEDAVAAATRTRPDVAVVDVDLPGMDGIAVADALQSSLPECRTLILTQLAQPGTLRRALAARIGGYLLKDAPADELAAAIRSVHAGRRVIDSGLALAAWDTVESPLTPRERDVLQVAATGAEATEIGRTLHLSAGTVRNYLTNINVKLSARNRVDAIRIAREAGWL
jgi:two-component system response regulator DesR